MVISGTCINIVIAIEKGKIALASLKQLPSLGPKVQGGSGTETSNYLDYCSCNYYSQITLESILIVYLLKRCTCSLEVVDLQER